MLVYDKIKIREALTSENIFDLIQEFGGDPSREVFGFLSATICHNAPGEGSRKLYYYENTGCLNASPVAMNILIRSNLLLRWLKSNGIKNLT